MELGTSACVTRLRWGASKPCNDQSAASLPSVAITVSNRHLLLTTEDVLVAHRPQQMVDTTVLLL